MFQSQKIFFRHAVIDTIQKLPCTFAHKLPYQVMKMNAHTGGVKFMICDNLPQVFQSTNVVDAAL